MVSELCLVHTNSPKPHFAPSSTYRSNIVYLTHSMSTSNYSKNALNIKN